MSSQGSLKEEGKKVRVSRKRKDEQSKKLERYEGGPAVKECRRPPGAGEGKETDCPLKPPKGTQPCHILDFRFLTSKAVREHMNELCF